MNTWKTLAMTVVAAATLASCNQQNDNKASSNTNDSTAVASNTDAKAEKIVYVNSDTLSEKYEYYKEIRTKLEAKVKKAQTDLQSKGQAFQREVADYQQKMNTMSASERQATEERLARKQDELGRLDQNASSSLAQDEATEFGNVYTAITEYLKKHAEDKGYTLVLTYSTKNPSVLYADKKLDITKQVVDGLNADYKKKNADKK
ncbi:OmpH family outer membrane protein [Sphingobacterium corticis]|uniref:OmpH family outer membrane protein n=1 Tax=Sphingobacterium corticis TaxID=1812823 RepID=A0ABW5NHI9_9SPHI